MNRGTLLTLLEDGLKAINADQEAFDELMDVFAELGEKEAKKALAITEKGLNIINVMKMNPTEIYTAKSLAPKLNVVSRSVAGSMRKLVTTGLVKKVGTNPTQYQLADDWETTFAMVMEFSDLDN